MLDFDMLPLFKDFVTNLKLFRSLNAQLEARLEAEIRAMVIQVGLDLHFYFPTLFTFTVNCPTVFDSFASSSKSEYHRWRSFEKALTDGFSFLGNPSIPKFLQKNVSGGRK